MKTAIKEYIRKNLEIDDDETINMLLDNYSETLQASIEPLRQALANRNAEALRMEGHSLKGCSANIGAEPIREIAYRLEFAGRNNDFAAGDAAFEELLVAVEAFLNA